MLPLIMLLVMNYFMFILMSLLFMK